MSKLSNNENTESPWVKARRLSQELSEALADCDGGSWFSQVMPPKLSGWDDGFGALPMGTPEQDLPIDRINFFAWQLAHALNDYQDGRFHARVFPSEQAGHAVMFTITAAAGREL